MKILITGATGLVGRHLASELIRQGHQIYCLVRSEEKFKETHIPAITIVGDLHQTEWIKELPHDLDGAIHSAGLVHSHNSQDFFRVNSEGTANLIRGLKERFKDYPFRFTLISSLAAVGPSRDGVPIDESYRENPVSDYGRSKLRGEQNLKIMAPLQWMTSIVRPPMVIGPYDTAFLDVFKMVQKGNLLLPGKKGGEKRYSFVCVYDLVELIIKVFFHKPSLPGEVYFAAHPHTLTYLELYESVANALHLTKLRKITIPECILTTTGKILSSLAPWVRPIQEIRLSKDKVKEITATAWVCSSQKASSRLNIHYHWDLPSTLKVTAESYRKAGLLKES